MSHEIIRLGQYNSDTAKFLNHFDSQIGLSGKQNKNQVLKNIRSFFIEFSQNPDFHDTCLWLALHHPHPEVKLEALAQFKPATWQVNTPNGEKSIWKIADKKQLVAKVATTIEAISKLARDYPDPRVRRESSRITLALSSELCRADLNASIKTKTALKSLISSVIDQEQDPETRASKLYYLLEFASPSSGASNIFSTKELDSLWRKSVRQFLKNPKNSFLSIRLITEVLYSTSLSHLRGKKPFDLETIKGVISESSKDNPTQSEKTKLTNWARKNLLRNDELDGETVELLLKELVKYFLKHEPN